MKKKVKVSSILMVLVPFILCMLVQVVIGMMGGLILGVKYDAEWIQDHMILVLMVTHLAMAAAFGFWYWNVSRDRRDSKIKDVISVRSIAIIVLYSIGLLILISGAYYILDLINPAIMEGYEELIGNAGLGTGIWSIIAAVFLAPIGEECVFRGLTLCYLEKTGAKFWIANLVQALLFGIMHGNIVQGTYAFVLGLLLGQVVNKYKSVFIGILFHMVFNLLGSTSMPFLSTDSLVLGIVIRIIGLAAVVLAFVLCSKESTRERRLEKRNTSFNYYQAYTPKKYRITVHIVLPVIFAMLGALMLTVKEFQGTMVSTVIAIFLIMEIIGDYVAFGASCSKTASPINWVKSSYKGRLLFHRVYGWDLVIRFIKYTVIWIVIGIIPVWCGNWKLSVAGYLLNMVTLFIGSNIVRRIDNVQFLSLVMVPTVGVAVAVMTLLDKFEFLMIPAIVVLAILMLVGYVLTYKLSIGAFEKSFHDV